MTQQLRSIREHLWQINELEKKNRRVDPEQVEVRRISDQELFVSNWSEESALGDSVWRMEHDYYLTQSAVFRPGDIAVDVGAHLGVFAIYLAKKYPFIKVYCLEPEPNNFASILRNVELNEVKNVIAINKGLTGSGGPRTLYSDAIMSNWSTLDPRVALSRSPLRSARVGTITLTDLFDEFGIEHCRMLKINALGLVGESLEAFTASNSIDFLCGEAILSDCSEAQLAAISSRIARHYFWRTIDPTPEGPVWSWIHQLPKSMEQTKTLERSKSSARSQARLSGESA